MRIVVPDLGLSNLWSARRALETLGHEVIVATGPGPVSSARVLVLPGVGAFAEASRRLAATGIGDAVREAAGRGAAVLGICLGMQLLTRRSEEGEAMGLGWIPGETRRLRVEPSSGLKIPPMGWNMVRPVRAPVLFEGLGAEPRFYFVHSYHVVCDDVADVAATCHYGHDFVCAVARENIMGVQFHPEKSHRFGLQLLKNFAERF